MSEIDIYCTHIDNQKLYELWSCNIFQSARLQTYPLNICQSQF